MTTRTEQDTDLSFEKGRTLLIYVLGPLLLVGPSLCFHASLEVETVIVAFSAGLGLLKFRPYGRWHVLQVSLFVMLPVILSMRTLDHLLMTGLLWLAAAIFLIRGLREVGRGDCWLWRLAGSQAELPRPWSARHHAAESAYRQRFNRNAGGYKAFLRGQSELGRGLRTEAVLWFAVAYRDGNEILRRRAVEQLEQLDEIESF